MESIIIYLENMATSYKIKIAEETDIPACVNLSMESWPNWWSGNMKSGKNHIKECVKAKRSLVAVSAGKIIAYCIWGKLWNKIHLQDVFVKKKFRRMGMATDLFEKMRKIAKKQGFKEIISDCDIDNKASIGFHLENGFKKCGYIKNNWAKKDSYVFAMKV